MEKKHTPEQRNTAEEHSIRRMGESEGETNKTERYRDRVGRR